MAFTYVVEHMEEDEDTTKAIPPWVELEYRHMRSLAGPRSQHDDVTSLAKATAHRMGILELMKTSSVAVERVCLLDPKATQELSPDDGDAFDWFLFGGILGDDPPRDRTGELRKLGFPTRHLGAIQMTTDTALGVTKKVVHDKVKLQDIPYIDQPTIVFNANESVEMPFRYISAHGEPLLPPGMRQLLYEDLDKGFEF